MALIYVPLTPGLYETGTLPTRVVGGFNKNLNHQISFTIHPSNPPFTVGKLTVFARSPGSQTFESIPGGVIDLALPETLLFQFVAEQYQFIVEDTVDSGTIAITDNAFGGVA